MVTAYDSTEIRDYSLKEDTNEPKTIFKLGTLDTQLRLYLGDKLTKYRVSNPKHPNDPAEIYVDHNEMQLETVRFGLRGWENFKDKIGQEVIFSTVSTSVPKLGNRDGLSDFLLKKLHPDWIIELGNEILYQNELSEEEKKI